MKVKILLLFFVSIAFYSCIQDEIDSNFFCEEQGRYLGNYPFSEETNALFPYDSGMSLVFLDSFGNEFVFTEGFPFRDIEEDVEIRSVCGTWGMDVHEVDTYTNHTKVVNYQNDSLFQGIYLSLQNTVLEITDTSFHVIDVLTVYAGGASFNYVTDARNSSHVIPDYYDNDLHTKYFEQQDILGKTFDKVYYARFDDREVYYNGEFGVIGFTDFNKGMMVFDRFE